MKDIFSLAKVSIQSENRMPGGENPDPNYLILTWNLTPSVLWSINCKKVISRHIDYSNVFITGSVVVRNIQAKPKIPQNQTLVRRRFDLEGHCTCVCFQVAINYTCNQQKSTKHVKKCQQLIPYWWLNRHLFFLNWRFCLRDVRA